MRCTIRHYPWSVTDHSTVAAVFKLETAKKGPGTFRCLPLLETNADYCREIKHTIRNTIIEVSNKNNIDKADSILTQHRINQLTLLYNNNKSSPQEEEELAILISTQPTLNEILEEGTEIGLDTVLDFTIKKVGNVTKYYQKELITNQENRIRDLNTELTSARNSGDMDQILKTEEDLDNITDQVCQLRQKKWQSLGSSTMRNQQGQ